jgi:hypothetical protein
MFIFLLFVPTRLIHGAPFVVPSIEEHAFLRQADMTHSVVAPEFDGTSGRQRRYNDFGVCSLR